MNTRGRVKLMIIIFGLLTVVASTGQEKKPVDPMEEWARRWVKTLILSQSMSEQHSQALPHGLALPYATFRNKSVVFFSTINRAKSMPNTQFVLTIGKKEIRSGPTAYAQRWRERKGEPLISLPAIVTIKEVGSETMAAYQIEGGRLTQEIQFELRDEDAQGRPAKPYFLIKVAPVDYDQAENELIFFLQQDKAILAMVEEAKYGSTKGALGAIRSAVSIYYGKNEGVFPEWIDHDPFVGTQENNYIQEIPKEEITGSSRIQYLPRDQTCDDGDGGGGWLYKPSTGEVWVNVKGQDPKGHPFNKY